MGEQLPAQTSVITVTTNYHHILYRQKARLTVDCNTCQLQELALQTLLLNKIFHSVYNVNLLSESLPDRGTNAGSDTPTISFDSASEHFSVIC